MHPVDEKDIRPSPRPEPHPPPLGQSARSMRRQIFEAEIRLRFDNHSARFLMQKNAAEQSPRELNRRPLKKFDLQRFGFLNQPREWINIANSFEPCGTLRFMINRQCTLEH